MVKKSSILPLPLLAEFFKIQFMHRYKFSILPMSFNNTWISNLKEGGGGTSNRLCCATMKNTMYPLLVLLLLVINP